MTREQKYPDTKTFHYYNANPKNRITGDCVIRAICTGMDIPWVDCVMDLAEAAIETGYSVASKENMHRYLTSHGWTKMPQPRKADNTKYTGEDFCKALQSGKLMNGYEGNIIAKIGGHHVVCIKRVEDLTTVKWQKVWKVCDIWNSTDGCIGNFWIKA